MSSTTLKNVLLHTNHVRNTTITAAAGVNTSHPDRNFVQVHRQMTSGKIKSYDDMVNSIAQTVTALRGQYHIFEDKYSHDKQKAWQEWLSTGVRLTWAPDSRYVLYEINSMDGVPTLNEYYTENKPDASFNVGEESLRKEMYNYIKTLNEKTQDDIVPPYQAFAQYGAEVFADTSLASTCKVGIDLPLVSTDHMKIGDEKELQWLNVAMHMVTSGVVSTIGRRYLPLNKRRTVCNIFKDTHTFATNIATQAVAPYPIQWKSTHEALAQALEIAAEKILGKNKMDKHMGYEGDAMNVIMGAVYFCIKPQANQVHLKTMYTQSDKIMPRDTKSFIRDIGNSHVSFLQALQNLAVRS